MGTSWMCRWWWWWRRRLKPLKGRMRWRWLYMILHNLHYRVSMHRLIFTHKQHFDLENTNLSSTFLLYFSFFFYVFIFYIMLYVVLFFLLYFFAFYIYMKEDDYFTILFISPVILGLYFKSMFLLYYIFFIFIFILELHYLYLYITWLMST